MKIYTKTGDKGETSLFGGKRVEKDHVRICAYGTVDELNASLGLISAYTKEKNTLAFLQIIQINLFVLGAELATPSKDLYLANGTCRLKQLLEEKNIDKIEEQIDKMEEKLPALTHFILAYGSKEAVHSQMARTICRRAERACFSLSKQENIRPLLLRYLNRLSDYLFVLSRKLNMDAGIDDQLWK